MLKHKEGSRSNRRHNSVKCYIVLYTYRRSIMEAKTNTCIARSASASSAV